MLFLYLTTQQFNNGKKTNLAFDVSLIQINSTIRRENYMESSRECREKGKMKGGVNGSNRYTRKLVTRAFLEARNSKVGAEVRTPFLRFHFSFAYPFPPLSSHAFPRLNGNSKFRPTAASSLFAAGRETGGRGQLLSTHRVFTFSSPLPSIHLFYPRTAATILSFFFFSFSSPANIFNHEAREKIWVSLSFSGKRGEI